LDKNSYFLFDEDPKKRINFYRGYMVNLLTLVSVLDYFPLGIPIKAQPPAFDFSIFLSGFARRVPQDTVSDTYKTSVLVTVSITLSDAPRAYRVKANRHLSSPENVRRSGSAACLSSSHPQELPEAPFQAIVFWFGGGIPVILVCE
jgi:hypothetical protein